jgi:catalase
MPSQAVFNGNDNATYTVSNGAPQYGEPYAAQRLGPNGPLLLQGIRPALCMRSVPILTPLCGISLDFHLIDSLAHFDHERVPERVV